MAPIRAGAGSLRARHVGLVGETLAWMTGDDPATPPAPCGASKSLRRLFHVSVAKGTQGRQRALQPSEDFLFAAQCPGSGRPAALRGPRSISGRYPVTLQTPTEGASRPGSAASVPPQPCVRPSERASGRTRVTHGGPRRD